MTHAEWPLRGTDQPRPDLDPPTVRSLRLPRPGPAPDRSATPNRDIVWTALRDAGPVRRWVAQRLVAAFATYTPEQHARLTVAQRERADRAIWAAEWLLDVPPGAVARALTELRTEQTR